jgi:Mrp family chromosome partitioning ATPase
MSAMDQVFIKAYGKGAMSHAADRVPHVIPPSPPVPPMRHDPGPIAPTVVGEPSLTPSSGGFVPLSDWAAKASTVPAPHLHLKPKPPTPAPTLPPIVSEQPALSPTVPAGWDYQSLFASFEVARFNWPSRVSQLTTAAAAGFTALATLIAQRSREGRKVLAIASTHRGEGRSTIAQAVARMIGNRNVRVALVDADFQRPQLGEQLQLAIAVGWEDVLAGDQPLREALIESMADRVTLLPLRAALPEPAVNDRHLVAETIEQLRRSFDLVVIDLGPLGDDTAALDFAAIFHDARIDDALVVRDVHNTTQDDLKRVGRRLSAAGVGHWDVVENYCT